MPIFLWLWTFRVDPHKTTYPHGHKHLEIAKSSQPKLPLWRTLGSKMMTCRWKCHGQQSINPKTSKDMLQLDVRMPLKDGWRFIYFRLKSWDSSTLWRWCGRGRSFFLSCSVVYLPCPSDLVGVGRFSAIIWDPVKVCPCACSANFSSGSLPLRTSGLPSSVLPTCCLKNSLPCLFFFSTLRYLCSCHAWASFI